MSDAPERIWMDGDIEVGEGYWSRCFEHPKQCSEPALEYNRADLHEAEIARPKADRDALRAAAEKIADALRDIVDANDYGGGILWPIENARASLTAWDAANG